MNSNLNFTIEDLASATKGNWINLYDNQKSNFEKIITDSRIDCSSALFIAICGEVFDGHNFIESAIKQNASALCVAKNKINNLYIPENIPVLIVENTTKAYQQIANFHRHKLNNCIFIGLTGSNGKTSTKDILASILSAEFGADKVYATKANTNNHIGVPQNILNVKPDHKYAIIEMGTNHPGELEVLVNTTQPDIAILTSIGPSHLEFFKSIKGVAKEKACIFKNFNTLKTNFAIIPYNCPEIETIKINIPENTIIKTFGFDRNSDISVSDYSNSIASSSFNIKWKKLNKSYNVESTLKGKHQSLNAAAAAAVSSLLGIEHSRIIKHLENPIITGMRMQISTFKNITCINDAYNANPASTKAGLDFLKDLIKSGGKYKNLHIVLGDMLELGESSLEEHISVLKEALRINSNSIVYAVGKIMNNAADIIDDKNIVILKDKNEAGSYLGANVKYNDIIYLKSSNGTGLREIESYLRESKI